MSLRKVFLGTFSEMAEANETFTTAQAQTVTKPEKEDDRRRADDESQQRISVKRVMIDCVTKRITGSNDQW